MTFVTVVLLVCLIEITVMTCYPVVRALGHERPPCHVSPPVKRDDPFIRPLL